MYRVHLRRLCSCANYMQSERCAYIDYGLLLHHMAIDIDSSYIDLATLHQKATNGHLKWPIVFCVELNYFNQ